MLVLNVPVNDSRFVAGATAVCVCVYVAHLQDVSVHRRLSHLVLYLLFALVWHAQRK